MITWLVSKALAPLLKLGEKYLDNENDRQKLEHGTARVAYEADAAVRKVKLGTLLGILPLFIAEVSCSIYLAAIFIDSTWPSDLINPLELPEWFKPHFYVIVASIFGISTLERVAKRRR